MWFGITFIDEAEALRTLSDGENAAALYAFKCSYGLWGIVVECLVEVRVATLCRTTVSLARFLTPEALADALLGKQRQTDALMAGIKLDDLAARFIERFKAGPGSQTPAESQPASEQYRLAQRLSIQHGGGSPVPAVRDLVHSRADFVNEYWRPDADEKRLDFQYYEHDIPNLQKIVTMSYRYTKDFEARTGFVPNA